MSLKKQVMPSLQKVNNMAGLLQNKTMEGQNIVWLEALRQQGREMFIANGLPTPKTEAWKYTKLRALAVDDFVLPLGSETKCTCDCHQHNHECSCGCNHCDLPFDAYIFRFYNGVFQPPHPQLPTGVEVLTLLEAVQLYDEAKSKLNKLVDINRYPFAALNTAYLEEGLFILISKNTKLDKPILLDVKTNPCDNNLFYNLHNLIVVENGAQAEIIENYHYHGVEKSRYFVNIVNEFYIGRDAKLSHYKLQQDAFKSCHIALNVAQVKARGYYENLCVQKGADIGRNEVVVKLIEPEASAQVDAAYKMSGWATLDTTTDIQHLSPHTQSDQLVKGVVDGDAKGVFQGRIHIAPDAIQTEGHQLHQALLLSDTAEVDVKPELEIFADDVKCSHGAASGELDEEQLFYMRSRGIDAEEARHLLVEAFLDDVILRSSSENIRNWLKEHI